MRSRVLSAPGELGGAVLGDALADERARLAAAREYATEHCVVCAATRASLSSSAAGPLGFSRHCADLHARYKSAPQLGAALRTPACTVPCQSPAEL